MYKRILVGIDDGKTASLALRHAIGLARAEAAARLKEHGYNEVPEKRGHPLLAFLGKFRGLSAWMLELVA